MVKVGVSDFFYAEIQEGLSEGEIVALELPKDEREKKLKQTASQHGTEGGPGGQRLAGMAPGGATNRPPGAAGPANPAPQPAGAPRTPAR